MFVEYGSFRYNRSFQVMIYVAEITQPKLRGALASTSTMSIIFGTMLQFVMATALEWRTIALINLAPPVNDRCDYARLCPAPNFRFGFAFCSHFGITTVFSDHRSRVSVLRAGSTAMVDHKRQTRRRQESTCI